MSELLENFIKPNIITEENLSTDFTKMLSKYVNFELITDYKGDLARGLPISLEKVDGFLLKNKHPGCKTFIREIFKKIRYVPIEDETRLDDPEIRHNFLVKVFAFAELRDTLDNLKSIRELLDFHQRYKYTLMSYSQKRLKILGRLLANQNKLELNSVVSIYKENFYEAFIKEPSRKSHINVLQHIYGYFSEYISYEEKIHFFEILEKYEEGLLPLIVPLEFVRTYSQKFEFEYLIIQRYLYPYPEELLRYKTHSR